MPESKKQLATQVTAWCGSALLGVTLLVAAALPAAGADPGCAGEGADSPMCAERQQAIDTRAKLEALLESLPELVEPPWSPAEFQTANTLYEEGKALYRDQYFGDAAAKFQSALAGFIAIEEKFEALVAQGLADAEVAMDAGDYPAAASEYAAVLELLPDSPEAAAGLATAKQGVAANQLLKEALHHLNRHDLAAAEATLQQIPEGLLRKEVGQARERINERRHRLGFNRSMSQGYRHLDQAEWPAAEAAFKDALKTDPTSIAAQDALEELRRRRADAELVDYRSQLETQLGEEDWLAAQTLLQKMQRLVPDDGLIGDALSRVAHLVDTEQIIDRHLSQPERISAKGVRDEVTALVNSTANQEVYGARITGKRAKLQQSLNLGTTQVKLTIRSDNRTEIRIRPGQMLGKFKERQLGVFPGDYALIGRRVGYRDVVKKITIQPDAEALTIEIVCNEQF